LRLVFPTGQIDQIWPSTGPIYDKGFPRGDLAYPVYRSIDNQEKARGLVPEERSYPLPRELETLLRMM
jgi:hypothetical protein